MDRWDFLKVNIPKYIRNPYIAEIIICDENGNDAAKLLENFKTDKLRVYVNNKCLGAFYNKRKVVSLAIHDVVCLMDSDNFAPESYFEGFFKYLDGNPVDPLTVYMPSRTIPQAGHAGFDFRNYCHIDITIKNANSIVKSWHTIMNTGNYILSKKAFEKASLALGDEHLGEKCKALDVFLQNYLLFKQVPGITMKLIPGMEYDHIVHAGSYWITSSPSIDRSLFDNLFSEFNANYTESSLNIIIVGPGIMPIPPTGWGAVEILIWDYAKTLEKLGHTVTILNNSNLNWVVSEIKRITPDVVHIQYDNHAHISEAISSSTKLIGITSHYGYLEQPNRWGGYGNVFNSIINQKLKNLYHFVLSHGIADIYKKFGVDSNKIIVSPNGANHTLFKYNLTPLFPDRSICLGKVETRKRQYIVQSIESLYFAGNNTDIKFNSQSSRYLGEWSKEYLYENLTNYGNLVLLSDGEADPLVVKEALICGLGVVISQCATANLDLSKSFITVIPEDKISNIEYVEENIKKNREYSVKNRAAIREYGLTFTWESIVRKYVDNIKKFI